MVDGSPARVVGTGLSTSVLVAADNNNNSGNNGAALGYSGLPGTFHHVLTHPTIGVSPTTVPTLSKVEFLDLDLNKLLSMSTHLAQLTLKMPFPLSTLHRQTHLGMWTQEPPSHMTSSQGKLSSYCSKNQRWSMQTTHIMKSTQELLFPIPRIFQKIIFI